MDISLSSPGFAVIEVRDRQAHLVIADHIKTDSSQPDGLRYSILDSFVTVFASKFKPFSAIVREDYKKPACKRQGQAIFGAWAAVDTGLQRCGLAVTDEINAAEVKRIVGGHGQAEKEDVAAGVRKLLRLPANYSFATDDESDACAVVLAWLIRKGLIDIG